MKMTRLLSFDWTEFSDVAHKEVSKLLRAFGLHVYIHPDSKGSDQYMLVVSDKKLTRSEVLKAGR